MAVDKGVLELSTFLNKRGITLAMYFYVTAVRTNMPTVSVEKAIMQFFKVFNIDGNEKSMLVEFDRCEKEYKKVTKSFEGVPHKID